MMNSIYKCVTTAIVVIAITLLTTTSTAGDASGEMLGVSIRSLNLTASERVVGFEVNVIAGRIASLSLIPIGWNISIDNDPTWQTRISGTVAVGAAALDESSFSEFITVEKKEFMGLKFEINAEIVVTEDFQNERRIRLSSKDLIVRPQ